MTYLVHVGIRPDPGNEMVYKTDELRGMRGQHYEILPNGKYRIWTKRMLKSGCGELVQPFDKLDNLVYCPTCQEYFSRDQFRKATKEEVKNNEC